MKGLLESAFAVAAFAGSEAYASNRPVTPNRPESYAITQSRHHHEHAEAAHTGNGASRPVLPAIRFTIR